MVTSIAALIEILKADYQRFPQNQTYDIYAEDVYFQDPLNSFRGSDRYRRMIGFIERWFVDPHLELHQIEPLEPQIDQPNQQTDSPPQIRTEWTLSWTAPFPWNPRLSIPGHTLMQLNRHHQIVSHIDYWHCSRWDVLKQALPFKRF